MSCFIICERLDFSASFAAITHLVVFSAKLVCSTEFARILLTRFAAIAHLVVFSAKLVCSTEIARVLFTANVTDDAPIASCGRAPFPGVKAVLVQAREASGA